MTPFIKCCFQNKNKVIFIYFIRYIGLVVTITMSKASKSTSRSAKMKSTFEMDGEVILTPRNIIMNVELEGERIEGPGECIFIVIWNGMVILEEKWQDGIIVENDEIPINLRDPATASVIADKPLALVMKLVSGKPSKDADPLLSVDIKAGSNIDMLPLLLGEEQIYVRVAFIYLLTGESTGCYAHVTITAGAGSDERSPLLLTMISATCLPIAKEGTAYVSSLGLDELLDPIAIPFGMSATALSPNKLTWSSIVPLGYAAASEYNIPSEDLYMPSEMKSEKGQDCICTQWNICKRVLIDMDKFRERLRAPFLIEIAGVPKTGKMEVRGRYIGFVDAGVLLEPGEYGVTVCAKMIYYSEAALPEGLAPLLELPPSSAKPVIRDTDDVMDEKGHTTYIAIRFDVIEYLVPKIIISSLYEVIARDPVEGPSVTTEELYVAPPPEDPSIDVRKIRKECGAQAVHAELSSMACTGTIAMNQSIKKTAANKLLGRIKSMLRQFPPCTATDIDWQDVVSGQHSAARRAVTASFAPQPPPPHVPSHLAAARSRLARDSHLANFVTDAKLKRSPHHPRTFLIKALRLLEERCDSVAREILQKGVGVQPKNKYLLWAFGSLEIDDYPSDDGVVRAIAVFRIAAKSTNNDGTANAIGWAALHTLFHHAGQPHAAFVAARKMRKAYLLPRDWHGFLQRWTDISGEEECLWNPYILDTHNPLLLASAFFLCLRSYKFSNLLLNCCENGCATRGATNLLPTHEIVDVYYLRAASYLSRGKVDDALEQTQAGIKRYGPCSKTSQMKATCLLFANGWDGECDNALTESEKAGAGPSPVLLLQAALGGMKTNPEVALQRAARAHKAAPCAHSALVLGRVYLHIEEDRLAERWAAAAVKLEPNLADAWAFMACIAIRRINIEKARSLLRTAYQVGPISSDIFQELQYLMAIVPAQSLANALVKELCLCDLY